MNAKNYLSSFKNILRASGFYSGSLERPVRGVVLYRKIILPQAFILTCLILIEAASVEGPYNFLPGLSALCYLFLVAVLLRTRARSFLSSAIVFHYVLLLFVLWMTSFYDDSSLLRSVSLPVALSLIPLYEFELEVARKKALLLSLSSFMFVLFGTSYLVSGSSIFEPVYGAGLLFLFSLPLWWRYLRAWIIVDEKLAERHRPDLVKDNFLPLLLLTFFTVLLGGTATYVALQEHWFLALAVFMLILSQCLALVAIGRVTGINEGLKWTALGIFPAFLWAFLILIMGRESVLLGYVIIAASAGVFLAVRMNWSNIIFINCGVGLLCLVLFFWSSDLLAPFLLFMLVAVSSIHSWRNFELRTSYAATPAFSEELGYPGSDRKIHPASAHLVNNLLQDLLSSLEEIKTAMGSDSRQEIPEISAIENNIRALADVNSGRKVVNSKRDVPAARSADQAATEAAKADDRWALFVDDSKDILEFYKRVAHSLGIFSRTAGSYSESCEVLRRFGKPAFLLTDLQMGDQGGQEVVRFFREHFESEIPVLVVSGNVTDSVREELEHLGNIKFISKPVTKKALFEEIRVCYEEKIATN